MRTQLQAIEEERLTFIGVFERYGSRTAWRGGDDKTVLLKDIRNTEGRILCDHSWFSFTKGFEALGGLKEGDIVQFDARVKEYEKGYVNYRQGIDERTVDYRLSHPTKIKKLDKENA